MPCAEQNEFIREGAWGGGGAEPSAAGRFLQFYGKNSDFNAILITLALSWSHASKYSELVKFRNHRKN